MKSRESTPSHAATITVLLIGTNRYANFFPNLVKSIDRFLAPNLKIQILVFTDQVDSISSQITASSRTSLEYLAIPSYGWPEATLLRYEIFENFWSHVIGEVVIYLDADTILLREISEFDLKKENWKNGVALVLHPGYFGRGILFRSLMKFTPLGPWESHPKSKAYVPRKSRNQYVCGGVWMGSYNSIEQLVSQLAFNVREDSNNKIMAKYHDESHINNWYVNYGATTQDPSWAYSDLYPKLRRLNPRIEVITKDESFSKDDSIKARILKIINQIRFNNPYL